LYAGAAPFWYTALRRVRRLLSTRLVPYLSIFSAFSFVVMMFNLPLPGGTTGHAVGVGVAAIVLGPWASMLAISVALFIQAVFFGDGGITALGANCFNMAIVGSGVAWAVFKLTAGGVNSSLRRKVIAAAAAGYAAINAAAFCAAIEFGIQPMLFHDAAGTPMYAPYPLSVALPAMMLGHLTIAGAAEAVLSGGVLSYLLRSESPLVARLQAQSEREMASSMRPLWVGLCLLLLATPLGILAAGSAWGEWSASDLGDSQSRAQIASQSLNHALPSQVPAGLTRLSSVWTSPFPDYAPAFVKSASFGYLLSAMFGVGLILGLWLLVRALMAWRRDG
jgi:cobalt/nickel transport system permease protein